MKNLKERYKKLQQEFSLPSYEVLDNEFEFLYVREIFEISRPLVFIRRRIYDKLGWACSMLQGIIQPNPGSIISIEESSFFTKEEKQKDIINLLKDLMYYERLSGDLDLYSTDEQEAKLIKEMFSKWKEVRPKIKNITSKLTEGWKNQKDESKKNNTYMG